VRIRRRVQEVEEGMKHRHACPRCAAVSVRRRSTGVCAYRPIVTTSFKRELAEAVEKPEPKAKEA